MEAIKTIVRSSGSPVSCGKAFWLVAKHDHGQVEVLTAELAGDVKALPVFGFEEEADLFLRAGANQDTGSNDGAA